MNQSLKSPLTAFPGPAYWIEYLSPPKYSHFLGHLVGWLTIALWWFVTVGNMLYTAQITVGLAEALNPGLHTTQWAVYLVSCGWTLLCFVVNLPGIFKVIPQLMTAGVFLINATWIYIFIAMPARATPKWSAHDVFVEIVNLSGWSSDGVVFLIAILPGILSVSGFDSVTHITDEVANPSKDIPYVIIGSALLSTVTGLVMAIMYSFCIVNPDGLLEAYGHTTNYQCSFRWPTIRGSSFNWSSGNYPELLYS